MGKPSYRELSKSAHYSVTALSEAAGGEVLPSLAVALAYVEACGGDRRSWEARWRAAAAALADEAPAEDAPYLGLVTFGPDDAERFFGRRKLIDELCVRLSERSLLAVFGASGSGKSSLLRAGLVPALRADAIAGSREWLTILFTPGENPVEELAAQLATLTGISAGSLYADLTAAPERVRPALRQVLADKPGMTRVAILVDQFEEVFTLCDDEHLRSCFVDCLLATADGMSGRARVVLGVRADFYARCAAYPAFVDALRDRHPSSGR